MSGEGPVARRRVIAVISECLWTSCGEEECMSPDGYARECACVGRRDVIGPMEYCLVHHYVIYYFLPILCVLSFAFM